MNASKVLAILFVVLLASGFLVYFFTPISSAATNIWCFPQNPLASCTTSSSSGTTTVSTNTQQTAQTGTTVSSSNNAISLSVGNRNPQIAIGGSSNDPFSITTTIPLNMTAIVPSGFIVSTSPKTISASSQATSGTVTIIVPNSITNGNYIVTLEAVSGPITIVAQTITVTATTPTPIETQYYYGVVSQFSLNITRAFVGEDGKLTGSVRLDYLIGGGGGGGVTTSSNGQISINGIYPAIPTVGFTKYWITVTSTATPTAPSTSYFLASFEVFGTLNNPNEVANLAGSSVYTANGWGIYLYSQQIPLSGGSFSVQFNNTALIDGEFNAQAVVLGQAQIPGNMANVLTAIGIPVSEGQGYIGVISSVQINDYRNVLDNIETVYDTVQIPSTPNPLNPVSSTSTTSTATSVCLSNRPQSCSLSLLQNGFALNLAGSAAGGPGVTSFWTVATATLWLVGGAGVIGLSVYALRVRRNRKWHY
jgi:hypothetical protein